VRGSLGAWARGSLGAWERGGMGHGAWGMGHGAWGMERSHAPMLLRSHAPTLLRPYGIGIGFNGNVARRFHAAPSVVVRAASSH
jgi:hypothetical protein